MRLMSDADSVAVCAFNTLTLRQTNYTIGFGNAFTDSSNIRRPTDGSGDAAHQLMVFHGGDFDAAVEVEAMASDVRIPVRRLVAQPHRQLLLITWPTCSVVATLLALDGHSSFPCLRENTAVALVPQRLTFYRDSGSPAPSWSHLQQTRRTG